MLGRGAGQRSCGTQPPGVRGTGSYELPSPASLYVEEEVPPDPGTSLTAPTGNVSTPTIEAESEGHITLDPPIANIQCQWSFKGTNSSHGPAEEATIPLSSLSTTGCTESWHGTTVTAGKLIILKTSGYNAKVTWTGATVEMTRLGTTCRYKTENTPLGTLTGGSPATIDLEMKLPFHSGSELCGKEAYSLTGSGPISTLTFTGCTNSWHVTTLTPGSLSVIATGGHGGFLYSNGAWIETTRFGVKCIYETFNTSIGTIWGGNPATISINALIPLKPFESSGLCGSGAASWEGSYVTTSALYFAQS